MKRSGVIAAGLVVAAIVLVAGGRAAPASSHAISHTCSATDRQFISAAHLNMESVGLVGASYLYGDAKPAEVILAANDADLALANTSPRDGSLTTARKLMRAMFVEYAGAVRLHAKGKDAAAHMYRAYSLANFAHGVLEQAQPGLARHGCNIDDLL